jgi:hypothetical protein
MRMGIILMNLFLLRTCVQFGSLRTEIYDAATRYVCLM